ncbi:helix-turn-helix transcriptional regulator [Brevibacterium sp. FAM 24630]|uniref:helix-turn-helix transcriptional regulator n=1 Tax=Brevibacterium sp. FAM 24630 TaxID=3415680 RepID=UPI003C7BEE17
MELIKPQLVADQLGVTTDQLAKLRYEGTGPAFVRVGPRSPRYRQEDIDDWVESRLARRTDEMPWAA